MNGLLSKALNAKSETKDIEFKINFDTTSDKEWVEIIKDLIAISNTGGGVILFGVDNSGNPTGDDVSHLLNEDPANITNKIFSYTHCHFSDFEIVETVKNTIQLIAFIIGPSKVPMIFTKPGTYLIASQKQDRAFSVGQVYFRHGAKSEPGTPDDLRDSIERRLDEIRQQWLSGVRQVVQAPEGAQFAVLTREVRQSSSPDAMPIRIVDDPSAPEYRIINPNTTHSKGQFELLDALHKELPGYLINSYDLLAIRKIYNIDEQTRFIYRPMNGSIQYSEEFVSWIYERCHGDQNFLKNTREKYKDVRYSQKE